MENNLNYEKIGERIKALRVKKGMTQGTLAELCGCSEKYISGVERATQNVPLYALATIADVLDVELDYFVVDSPRVSRVYLKNTAIPQKLSQLDKPFLAMAESQIDAVLALQNELDVRNK